MKHSLSTAPLEAVLGLAVRKLNLKDYNRVGGQAMKGTEETMNEEYLHKKTKDCRSVGRIKLRIKTHILFLFFFLTEKHSILGIADIC